MTRFPNISKIETFTEVLGWIAWDLEDQYPLRKGTCGNFYVNKLTIEPKYLTYKEECAELSEGLFEKVEVLYNLLED